MLLVVGGPRARAPSWVRRMAEDAIAGAAEHAAGLGVPLASEPPHPMQASHRTCVNTLAQALDPRDPLSGVGLAVDAFDAWRDPDLATPIAQAGDRTLAHHLFD